MRIDQELKKADRTSEERGIPANSHFTANLYDGSEIKEQEYNWSDLSEETYVEFNGSHKVVRLSKHPVKSITVTHGDLTTTLEAQQDEQVYQAITCIATFKKNGSSVSTVIGRKVGKVKNGKVIEERYLDGQVGQVFGLKF